MAWLNPARSLYALAVMLMPLSYGTKFALGIEHITWVNPTLILASILFLLVAPRPRPLMTLVICALGVISAVLGAFYQSPQGYGFAALYDVLREPIRLLMNFLWFWVSLVFLRRQRPFVVKWLAVSVVVQLFVALTLWCGALGIVSLPEPIGQYVREYAGRQALWLGGMVIPRLGGTFIESPPFGLFMFCSFVILSVAYLREGIRSNWLMLGWSAALLGTIWSLSLQVILGFLLFLGLTSVSIVRRRGWVSVGLLSAAVVASATPYLARTLQERTDESRKAGWEAYGTSGGERAYHSRYSRVLLSNRPGLILLGIGPGRYGQYVAKTGIFPATVTHQFTAVEWVVEYGALATAIILAWLWSVFRRALRGYGFVAVAAFVALIVANMFQANWKWEAWFLALAFLYTAPLPVGQRLTTETTLKKAQPDSVEGFNRGLPERRRQW